MKKRWFLTIDAYDLQSEIEKHLGHSIELCQLLWPEDFYNYSFKSLSLDTDEILTAGDFGCEDDPQCIQDAEDYNKTFEILRELFPDVDRILVDVSW